MTKEEWKQVEDALQYFYKNVELEIDGYTITLALQRVSVMVYPSISSSTFL